MTSPGDTRDVRTEGAAEPDPEARKLSVQVGQDQVSALLLAPSGPRALFVYGHGAGAGMAHPFMEASSRALLARGIATFRYNFPYMERRSGGPDHRAVLLRTVRAAVNAAAAELAGTPLLAGGKSMGGRMTSEAQAESPLPGVEGLIFVGFPLHRPKQPSTERARHLSDVDLPMLFLQGTRDEMADLELIRTSVGDLGPRATLHVVEGADHGFNVLKRSGRDHAAVLEELADRIDRWVREVIGR